MIVEPPEFPIGDVDRDPHTAPAGVFDNRGMQSVDPTGEVLMRGARICQMPDAVPALVQPAGARPPPMLDECLHTVGGHVHDGHVGQYSNGRGSPGRRLAARSSPCAGSRRERRSARPTVVAAARTPA
jgi:hypothetical protein